MPQPLKGSRSMRIISPGQSVRGSGASRFLMNSRRHLSYSIHTVGNKTFPMFAHSAQIHLYLSKYIFQNHKNNNADALTSYLKYAIILNFHTLFWHVFHIVQISHSLERFCCHLVLNTNNSNFVFTIAPLCFNHHCKPSRHAFNQFLTLLF